MINNAGNDIQEIKNNGNGNNNLVNSTQHIQYGVPEKKIDKQAILLQLKVFLSGNIQIATQIKKKMSLPLVERFDIYRAEQLEDGILVLLPEFYSEFHDLRLALEKANKIIETAYTEYTRPVPPQFANQGRGHIGAFWLNELRLHIDQKIEIICMKMLSSELIVSEDELHI